MKMTEEWKQIWRDMIKNDKICKMSKAKAEHFLLLLDHPEIFNSGKFKDNILKNEFDNMSEEMKNKYKKVMGIDIDTMKGIVDLLYKYDMVII